MLPRDSKLIRISLLVFFALLLAYALYEGWGLISGPAIHVPTSSITTHEQYTLIRGRAERITELRLNGTTISVTESGEFQEPYLLAEGSNRLVLEARDARGRIARETLDIIYIPEEVPASPSPATTTGP